MLTKTGQIAHKNVFLSMFMMLLAAIVTFSTHAEASSVTYTYDDLNRLITVSRPEGSSISYNYDEVGNRISKTVTAPDSDNDGLSDGLEESSCTDPNDADTDDDGISDGVEDANQNGMWEPGDGETNPCNRDTDGDGIQDGTELGYTLSDILPDTDTNIFQPDIDPGSTTDPLNDDTDNDGLLDGEEDINHNGRIDPGETDPTAGIWYVDGSVGVSGDGKTWNTALKTIQEGINTTADGDTVLVAAGTYFENINLIGKAITIQSYTGADSTIIDGNYGPPVVTISSNETEDTVLDGFTLRNGSPGIDIINSSPVIKNCKIIDCYASGGGGISCDSSSSKITNCILSRNTASNVGGGMDIYDSSVTITNCTFYGNNADGSGGGIYIENSSAIIKNSIFWGNTAPNSPEIQNSNSSVFLFYCDIEGCGGSGGDWDTSLGTDSGGNTDADPLFVDPDGLDNIPGNEDDDFHLQHGSPVIDKGDPVEILTADYTVADVVLGVDSVTAVSVEDVVWITDGVNTENTEVAETNDTSITVVNGFSNSYLVADHAYVYTVSSDFSNEPEPNGGRINIGAYGGTSEATLTPVCSLDPRFEETTLSEGMYYYTDRTYTLTSVPSQYLGMDTIIAPNDDRDRTDASDYMTFEMPSDTTVYVAFDRRASSLPDWMSGFTYTGYNINTSLGSQQYLRIYSKSYSAGVCVNFGANKAPGFSGATVSNYMVFYE